MDVFISFISLVLLSAGLGIDNGLLIELSLKGLNLQDVMKDLNLKGLNLNELDKNGAISPLKSLPNPDY